MRKRFPIGLMLVSSGLLLGFPAVLHAQASSPDPRASSGRAQLGAYVGLLGERTKLDGKSADALEEESGRFGVLFGPWSFGYSEKRLSPGFLVSTGNGPIESVRLRSQGFELGRVLSTRRFVQPAVYLTISRGTVQRDVLSAMLSRQQSDLITVTLVEPAVSAGIPIWRVGRAELRAGMRLGRSVTFENPNRSIATSGPFVSALMSVGWFGDWSRGWVW